MAHDFGHPRLLSGLTAAWAGRLALVAAALFALGAASGCEMIHLVAQGSPGDVDWGVSVEF